MKKPNIPAGYDQGPLEHRGPLFNGAPGEIFNPDGICIAYVRYNETEGDPVQVATAELFALAPDLVDYVAALEKLLNDARLALSEYVGVFGQTGGATLTEIEQVLGLPVTTAKARSERAEP